MWTVVPKFAFDTWHNVWRLVGIRTNLENAANVPTTSGATVGTFKITTQDTTITPHAPTKPPDAPTKPPDTPITPKDTSTPTATSTNEAIDMDALLIAGITIGVITLIMALVICLERENDEQEKDNKSKINNNAFYSANDSQLSGSPLDTNKKEFQPPQGGEIKSPQRK